MVALAGGAGVVAAAMVVVIYVGGSSKPAEAIGVVAGVVALMASAASWSWGLWRWGRSEPSAPTSDQLAQAAGALGASVRKLWHEEAAHRGITTPATVMVNWQLEAGLHTTGVDSVTAPPPEGVGPKPIPSVPPTLAPELLTEGVVTRLYDLYAALPHGRLVILGEAGAGKTSAAILLLLHAYARRDAHLHECAEYRQAATNFRAPPVPVLVTLEGWNPAPGGQSLRTWAAAKVARVYQAGGPKAVERLLDSAEIALFLDGLDELPKSIQAAAVKRITDETDIRIVLTSRPSAFANAVQRNPLYHAAVIQLQPVNSREAAAYLRQVNPQWNTLADRLQANPNSPAAQALNTPLTLGLLRTIYRETGDPGELADSGRFPTAQAVTAHLLDGVLPAAYDNPHDLAYARRWLGCIAYNMSLGGIRDLAWWQITSWIPPRLRLAGRLVRGILLGLFLGLVFGSVGSWLYFAWGFFVGLIATAPAPSVKVPRSTSFRRPTWRDLGFDADFFIMSVFVFPLFAGLGLLSGLAVGLGRLRWFGEATQLSFQR